MTSNLRKRPSVVAKKNGSAHDGNSDENQSVENISSLLSSPGIALPSAPKPKGCPVNKQGRSWIRKAAVVLVPAYSLSVMFDVLEPPGLLVRHALDDIRSEFLGTDSRVFSAAELQALSGGKRPMLSILGEVFDVSKGAKHYGRGGGYQGFTGRDASRAFVTGDFTEEGLTDDVTGLEPSQCLGIKDWLGFYKKDATIYQRKGVLAGTFYDEAGQPTAALKEFERCVTKGKRQKEREEAEKKLYPNCNSRWASGEGGKVWCEDPKKVPRKIPAKTVHGTDVRKSGGGLDGKTGAEEAKEDDKDAKTAKGRCACFDPEYANKNEARLLSYGGCAPDANRCVTKPP